MYSCHSGIKWMRENYVVSIAVLFSLAFIAVYVRELRKWKGGGRLDE